MSKAYQQLMEELEAEQNAPAETPNPETPAETPAETPKPEEHEDAPKPDEKPEEQPAETPNPDTPVDTPKKRPSEHTPEERAQFAFQRQLAKEREKHARELEDLKKGWESKFEELKKATKQPEPEKTRADFENDDQFIDYLVQKRYEKERAADAEKAAKDAEERAKQQAEQDEQNRILQAEQQAWLTNVDNAFGEDKTRSGNFLKRVEYCMSKGLGEVLDACPVASDFLLHSARGPVVFEALLNDRAKFERVFNDRSTPMDQYYELRQIENELNGKPSATPAPAPQQTPAPAPMPHLGKPGKGGNATEPDIFSDEKAMRSFLRSGH